MTDTIASTSNFTRLYKISPDAGCGQSGSVPVLSFATPANGWSLIYSVLGTTVSLVVAYFLGVATEYSRERWRRFDDFAASVDRAVRELYTAACAHRVNSEAGESGFWQVWWNGQAALHPKDRHLFIWIIHILEDSRKELTLLAAQTPGQLLSAEDLKMRWLRAQQRPQRARSDLIAYRQSRGGRKQVTENITAWKAATWGSNNN